ncbi:MULTISPECIES: hypothetical protein [unclassified Bradyrhizobium]|uniref:hypothetical protein n=1 Tax=unclassified Bradyrhizobium TaxID=2631580 RepID=UPI001FF93B8E|nr:MULTISPECIES: hypothetical protein [unclassified Bradyrhizobium]MCK1611051.1 hypothetical protein [Bradyrhizobium sp. 163]MCK1762805.1 hypothetical protein [Bradyrhizobium sp. 136]
MIETLKAIAWSNVVSILFGAALSATVSYLLQRNSFAEARRLKDHDRYESRRAQAYSLFFKLIRIHSNIVLLGRAITESIGEAEKYGLGDATLWQKIQPVGNLPPPVKFSSDEMALLLSLDTGLFNALGPYDEVHNSLLDVFELYKTKRQTLMERFGAKMTGSVGVTGLTQSDADWMSPRAVELNGLAEVMLHRTNHDSDEAKSLLEQIHALFVKQFKMNPRLEFKAD